MSTDSDHFHTLDEDLIIVKEQSALAVYFNVSGGVTIRKQRDWNEDDDTFIVTSSPEAARAVADAIYAELGANCPEGDAMAPWRKDLAAPEPKDMTAAERQRRHRGNKRRSNGTQGPHEVTPRRDSTRDNDRDVTRDGHDVTLFGDRDAPVTLPARTAA